MARETEDLEQKFALTINWPAAPVSGGVALLDASLGKMKMCVGNKIATAFRSDKGDTGTSVELPLYDMVEWITANWWPLLYEPAKGDTPENYDFRSRHWLGAARKGMALPSVWFSPTGDEIEVSCQPTYLRFSRLTFTEGEEVSIGRADLRNHLDTFVQGVLDHLCSFGLVDTLAHRYWKLINDTRPETELYCRLLGSMGLSPYSTNDRISKWLDEAADRAMPESVLIDICEAADASSIEGALLSGSRILSSLEKTQASTLSVLSTIPVPNDSPTAQSWRWGVDCSKRVQAALGISPFDAAGSSKFFDAVGIHVSKPDGNEGTDQISAAMRREDLELRVALTSQSIAQQRFAAVRAAFMGWTGPASSTRLITAAKTRKQQASRAFAAQLLAPIEFIRARSLNQNLNMSRVTELAEKLNVSPSVVKYQATNNQISIS